MTDTTLELTPKPTPTPTGKLANALRAGKKANKARHCNAIVYPRGGAPYTVEVVVDEDGTIEHEGMCWMVSPNSIALDKKGNRWVSLPEAAAETITGDLIVGLHYMDAHRLIGYKKDKTLEQLWQIQNSKEWYRKGETWLNLAMLAGIALVLVWMTIATGGGLDGIAETLQGMQLPAGDSPPAAGAGTHNTLTPR